MLRFTKKCLCLYSINTKQIVMKVHSVYLMLHQGRLYVVPFRANAHQAVSGKLQRCRLTLGLTAPIDFVLAAAAAADANARCV